MAMSRLTVTLPDGDISFLKKYAKQNKTTVSGILDKWIKNLRKKPDIPPDIHPDIERFTGIIPENIDIDKALTDSIMEKHK